MNIKTPIILIAEDEDINFFYLTEVLRSMNLEIIHAKNGQIAVDICKENENIQLILMDIKMPVMDGYEATRLIRTFRPNIPIIATSAFEANVDSVVFNEYLRKPINVFTLKEYLSKYLK